MANPVWYEQLNWWHPRPVTDFLHPHGTRSALATTARRSIPIGSGLYAFLNSGEPIKSVNGANVLYIGKADGGRQSLRNRLSVYFRRFARPNFVVVSRHAGLDLLDRHHRGMLQGSASTPLFVTWAGVASARHLEGELILRFDPPYNGKDEALHYYDDEEEIPGEFL